MSDDLCKKYGVTPSAAAPDDLYAKYGVKSSGAEIAPAEEPSTLMKNLTRVAHGFNLAIGGPEASDVSRASKGIANWTGLSQALYGKDLPVSENSKTLQALRGLISGKEELTGYGDALREIDVPSADLADALPFMKILKATGAIPENAKTGIDTNTALGLGLDVAVNPGGLTGLATKLPGTALKGAGNRIYNNAWRFITREFGGAGKSKNPGINKEAFLEMMKKGGVGKGAHSPQDIATQWEALVAKESQPLNELYSSVEGAIPLADPSKITSITSVGNSEKIAKLEDMLVNGNRATREGAIEGLKQGVSSEFHPFLDEMKKRLITSKGQVQEPLRDFLNVLQEGPLSLDLLRTYKGDLWKTAKRQGGTPAGDVLSELAGGTNDLIANTLEKAASGGEETFREANKRVATLLKPEKALMNEVRKQAAVAPNTALDAGLEGLSMAKLLVGDPKAAIELALGLTAKKGGKALNSLATGSRYGQRFINTGEKIENLGDILQNARGNAWARLRGNE